MIVDIEKLKEFKLYYIKTNTILDKFYLKYNYDEKKLEPLGGIPRNAIIQFVGTNGTGKSLMAVNITKNLIQNQKVVYITTETPAEFIYYKIKEKTDNLKNLFLIDLTRELDMNKLFEQVKQITEEKETRLAILDSITGFYENLENKARIVVRSIYNFFKRFYYTAIFISQKRSSHDENNSEAAGGLAVAHIVDSTVVFMKKIIQNKWEEEDYKVKKGRMVRIIRVDDCRICPHITTEIIFKITEDGEFEIVREKEV